MCRDVQRLHVGRDAQVDVVGRVVALVVDEDLVEPRLALEVFLREGRSLVGPNRFVTQQDNPALEPFLAEGLRRLGARQAGAHDDEGTGIGHVTFLCCVYSVAVGQFSSWARGVKTKPWASATGL